MPELKDRTVVSRLLGRLVEGGEIEEGMHAVDDDAEPLDFVESTDDDKDDEDDDADDEPDDEVDLDVVAAAGVLGAEDSLEDLGIELDLDALDGDEDLDEEVVTTDEEQQ